MHTNLRVDGANCPLCLNELIDRLRSVDGVNAVNSSITQGCIAVDHTGVAEANLVELIGTSLHGIALASNEIVMTTITPVVSVLHCRHEQVHVPPSVTAPSGQGELSGSTGTYSAAYGPTTPPNDTAVLQQLAHATHQKDPPRPMSRVRIHNFSISLDGFATGEGQSFETPFGHAGHRLHEWMFATRFAHREILGEPGGTEGFDDVMAERHGPGIGAEIMGAHKFGPPGWQDDPNWRGWWGDNPPFHTPTYVLTHHPLPPMEMEGGTTFHFLDATPADALDVARDAAAGQDIRIGGGPTMIRAFLADGLVDSLHVVQVPILLGRGVRLWDGLEALEQQYAVEAVTTPSGVTHLTFTR